MVARSHLSLNYEPPRSRIFLNVRFFFKIAALGGLIDECLDTHTDRDLAKVPSLENPPPKPALLPKQPSAVYVIVEIS